MIDWLNLTGQQHESTLAATTEEGILLQPDVIAPLSSLRAAAQAAGFDLRVASGYRSFARQLLIWNAKANGQRPLLDSQGEIMDPASLSDDDKLFAILRWSAIPGCSRHHWGTDMDIYDTAAMPPGYTLQLTPAEVSGDGPFAPLHDWLDTVLARPDACFYRPYAQDRGGIAPERWHLSYQPLACSFEAMLDEGRLIDWLMTQDIALKERIRQHWHAIFHRFVLQDATP